MTSSWQWRVTSASSLFFRSSASQLMLYLKFRTFWNYFLRAVIFTSNSYQPLLCCFTILTTYICGPPPAICLQGRINFGVDGQEVNGSLAHMCWLRPLYGWKSQTQTKAWRQFCDVLNASPVFCVSCKILQVLFVHFALIYQKYKSPFFATNSQHSTAPERYFFRCASISWFQVVIQWVIHAFRLAYLRVFQSYFNKIEIDRYLAF